jgi:hypothetical protein
MVWVTLILAPFCMLHAADPSMTAQERARVVQLLRDSEKEYLSAIEDVNEAQWNWKPAPDRWSVGQTAEHILLAEITLFRAVEQAIKAPPDPDWEQKTSAKTEVLERVMPDRSGKGVAPEQVQPQGLSKAEVIRRFKELRAQTIKFAVETQVPLKEHTFPHPFPIFKVLNAYQWLLYIPLHNLRHDQQIAEVKRTMGYPTDNGQPASQPAAPSSSEHQPNAQSPAPFAEAQGSFRAQMLELQEQADQARQRAKVAQNSLTTLKGEMAAQGVGLRSDVLGAESRMSALLWNAQRAIAIGDAVTAERDLELTQYALAFVENFLGR